MSQSFKGSGSGRIASALSEIKSIPHLPSGHPIRIPRSSMPLGVLGVVEGLGVVETPGTVEVLGVVVVPGVVGILVVVVIV